MNKFEDVDVIASLEAIMKQNTAFYQNDFDLDRNILQKAAASPTAEDRRLLWFSRPSGTSCFRERDVFLKGTRQHEENPRRKRQYLLRRRRGLAGTAASKAHAGCPIL